MDTSLGLPFTRWFPGGLLNAYDSAVLRHRRSDPDGVALIGETEAGTGRQPTYAQLEDAGEQTAAGLRAVGVERGGAGGPPPPPPVRDGGGPPGRPNPP